MRPPEDSDPPSTGDEPPDDKPAPAYEDPLAYLRTVMNDPRAEASLRVRAAVTIATYQHAKPADKGKKLVRQEAADEVAKGRFAPAAAPTVKLVRVQ